MSVLPSVFIRENSVSDHPWVYGMHLDRDKSDKVRNGSPALLFSANNQYLGFGFVNFHARVGFRLIGRKRINSLESFKEELRNRIHSAVQLRLNFKILDSTNALRLIYSEGDFLSGLVVDAYADGLVVQYTSSGMYYLNDFILECLKTCWEFSSVYVFAESHVQKQESFDLRSDTPPTQNKLIHEHNIHYAVKLGIKHKSGFYSDQREARKKLAYFTQGKRVLDLCSFSGGFALNALGNGSASHVTCVELDEEVIPLLNENFTLNHKVAEVICADAVQVAKNSVVDFDVVVFDPPKMLKDQREKNKALHRYAFMNEEVMRNMKANTIFITCSCSGLISRAEFEGSLRKASIRAGKSLQIFDWTQQGFDHPYSIYAPEGAYLKVAWCLVK